MSTTCSSPLVLLPMGTIPRATLRRKLAAFAEGEEALCTELERAEDAAAQLAA